MRWMPKGYGGKRRSTEQLKRDGWREQNLLVVSPQDRRLAWPERELVALSVIAWRLNGRRPPPAKRARPFVVERARALSR